LKQREQTLNTPKAIQRNAARAEVLSLERHKHLKFLPTQNYSFAAGLLYLPIHADEASQVAQDYPILFSCSDDGIPSLCMLMRSHQKSALDTSGRWQGVLPDVIRLYPFGWTNDGKNNRLTLYPDAPHFAADGEKLITSRGKPTQRLNQIIQAIKPVQNSFAATAKLMQELKELEVIKPLKLNFAGGGQTRSVTLWTAAHAPNSSKTISADLKALLEIHKRSVIKHLQPAQTKVEPKAQPQVQPDSAVVETVKPSTVTVDDLISRVCDQYDISEDDLRSRKRSEPIRQARATLSQQAEKYDCLEPLADSLNRTVATIKKWC
jgi:hypothetical protein